MARIPVAVNDQQAPAPGPAGGLQAGDPGPGIGAGVQALGQGIDRIAQVSEDQKIQLDDANTKNLHNQYVTFRDDLLHSGSNPYLITSGQNALDAKPAVEQALQEKAANLLGKATSPYQRQRLGDIFDNDVTGDLNQVRSHYAEQHQQYDVDQTTARIGVQSATAGNNYADPGKAEDAILTLKSDYENMAHLKGWSPEVLQFQTERGVSGVRKDIVQRLSASGPNGPKVAQSYLDRFSSDFTSDDAAASQTHIQTFQNHYDAEARRAAADAHRQLREDQQDAAARVDDGLRTLETGTPLPPQQLASLKDDARASGRRSDALSFRLDNASFKNNLNVEYQNATPAEIQTRVDALGTTIAKAGGSPKMEDVVEYNHLQGIQAKAATSLRESPLHWGAAHLGIPITPINLSDPNSIASRMQAAQSIAARTGLPPQMLTPEEAAQYAPVAVTGTVEQKRGLIFNLAKFGDKYAADASRQVAPSDPALAGLVSLATLPVAGVAQNLVTKALTGPDIMKAHPKIINESPTLGVPFGQQFDAVTGSLFQYMPKASAGIRANARNFLAANGNAAGVYETVNKDKDGHEVLVAVNDALGAYNDQGVQRGGIASDLAGHQTILPQMVSENEFHTAIARAGVPQLTAAGNGLPVWSNGKPLFTGDIKNMRWVPVDNGKYALDSGAGIIRTKEGKPYVIDFGKLR